MLIDKNIISFALKLLISIFLVLSSLSKIMSIYSREGKNINWLIKLPGFITTINESIAKTASDTRLRFFILSSCPFIADRHQSSGYKMLFN